MDLFLQRSASPRKPLETASSNAANAPVPNRPHKRLKIEESQDSDSDSISSVSLKRRGNSSLTELGQGEELDEVGSHAGEPENGARETAFESSLPSVETDEAAIEEYEVMRASQAEDGKAADGSTKEQSVRGKSSIYVDAFNLALDTVLEDEAHLFDAREKAVFEDWKSLSYEAQYLYVRLFLRKTSAWHRIEKLGYYNDVSDPEAAIQCLQEARHFSAGVISEQEENSGMQDWSLGDSFAFADTSESSLTGIEEAASLLSLDELKALAKETKVTGKNKTDLLKAFCRMSTQQAGLLSLGLRRSSTEGSSGSRASAGSADDPSDEAPHKTRDGSRGNRFLGKVLSITGPCIRLSEPILKLFERVHLVFYRSTEWTEKSLTTIILAKIARRNFPEYIVDRSSNIFPSRYQLLEFEQAMRMEFEVDKILEFNGPPGEVGFRRVLELFDGIAANWRGMLREEQRKEDHVYQFNEGSYLRRFCAAHPYTRIAHKAGYVMGRLKQHAREHALLTELLDQRLFHLARRGAWYQRKALLEEHYMWETSSVSTQEKAKRGSSADAEQQKRHWRRIAVTTCETALEDAHCHLIYHYDLQKRLLKLEKRLRVPRRLQHDFGHVVLREPEEHFVEGIQLKKDVEPNPLMFRRVSNPGASSGSAGAGTARGPSTKTIWVDEAEGGGECSVEAMCLSWYRSRGWKGYHAEGGIVRTLFAYLFFDVLFLYVPGVFQTAYQAGPLDLHGGDGFYPARASEINHRLVEIANGGAERLVRNVDDAHRERRTCVVGLNWDYEPEDVLELVRCFDGAALAAVCKVMAQEYRQRGGGVPDLLLWRTATDEGSQQQLEPSDKEGKQLGGQQRLDGGGGGGGGGREDNNGEAARKGEVMFVEVKSANDRLSDTQRLWIHVLTGAGVRVALCNAVAKEVRAVS